MRRSTALILVASALCGCKQSSPAPDAAFAPPSFVGRACGTDSECGTLRCDPVRHQCICLSDESCRSPDPNAPPMYCDNYTGLCLSSVPGCTTDARCPAGQYCDPAIRACAPFKNFCSPCSGANQCGPNNRCLYDGSTQRRFCATACQSSATCVRGASCQSSDAGSFCWPALNPPTTCLQFGACTPDSLRSCNSDADCGDSTQRCDPAAGICIAVLQACPPGTACDPNNQVCVAQCSANSDCDPAQRCIHRVCQPALQCADDSACSIDRVCDVLPGADAGACIPSCRLDAECPLGAVCLNDANGRYACRPGCAGAAGDGGYSGAGCPLTERCNPSTHQCEGPVVGTTQTCQADSVCGVCQFCDRRLYQCTNATASFPYCASCNPATAPTDCPGGFCVLMPSGNTYCARDCSTNPECPNGFVCLMIGAGASSACVPADLNCVGKCL